MILDRLSHAIRQQNWFAVALEFVIVIAGVVIGFQITAWNQERGERAYEQMLIARLSEEFQSIRGPLEETRAEMRATMMATGQVIDALRAADPPGDEAAFREALRRANYIHEVPALATSFSELVATGGIERLTDRELRAALTAYSDTHSHLLRQYETANAVVGDPQSAYLRAVSWNTDPATWSGPEAIIEYDFEALRLAEAELQMWQAFQNDLAGLADDEAALIDNIIAQLHAEAEE